MKTPLMGCTPRSWLASIGFSSPKIDEILASYSKTSLPTVYTYSAPNVFLRFHGSFAKTKIYDPNYWVDSSAMVSALDRASQFENYLSDPEIRRIAKNYYREITAICNNWNDLNSNTLWKIELRGAELVEGLEGQIAQQPTHAATKTESASTSILRGGAIQVFLHPKTPFICTPIDWDNN